MRGVTLSGLPHFSRYYNVKVTNWMLFEVTSCSETVCPLTQFQVWPPPWGETISQVTGKMTQPVAIWSLGWEQEELSQLLQRPQEEAAPTPPQLVPPFSAPFSSLP